VEEQLLETWRIHNRVNLYMLGAVPPEAMGASVAPKGRSVFALFAHMHDVRLLWLKAAAPELLGGLAKVGGDGGTGSKEPLIEALTASGDAIEAMLRKALAAGGRVKGFKPHAVAFLGYLIAHEAHHRGQAGWALKFSGHPLDKKTAFGLWEWGVR
jgi:uncharacterized damage-inducible protein DinB